MLKFLLAVFAAWSAAAQTRIDLRSQAGNIDFTGFPSTKPVKMGTELPPMCGVGELFFKSDGPAGANLYACSSVNQWSLQGGMPANCQVDSTDQILKCQDGSGTVYAVVKTQSGGTPNQWVDYIGPTGTPHTSQPTAAAVGAVGDPGMNGIPYRSGPGTAAAANASQLSGPFSCQDAGGSSAYACNLNPPISGYTVGTTYWFRANSPNTGAATINFNGLGAKTIVKQFNQPLAANDIRTGQWVMATYDGTNMQMQSQTGNAPGAVSSVFGRAGIIVPQSGDYTTAQVTESGNLYFTNARARAAVSAAGPLAFDSSTGIFGCPTCLTSGTAADTDLYGTYPHLSVVRLQGRSVGTTPPGDGQYLGWNSSASQWEPKTLPAAPVTSIFGRSGPVTAQNGDYTTAQVTESGNLYFTNARARAAVSGGGPIAFNSSTGAFDCPTCITTGTTADTDLTGAFPHLNVARLQGRSVATTPPGDAQYLAWNASANRWEPKTPAAPPVTSIFGRAGAVTPQAGDYSFSQIGGTLASGQLPATAMRTDGSNTVIAGTQDMSNAAHTLPMKTGLKADLPALCTPGETYFATDAQAGENVYGCTALNTWSAQGTFTLQSEGSTVGTGGAVNFQAGAGMLMIVEDTGSGVTVTQALDTAAVQTRFGEQSGSALLCASGGGSATAYSCSLNPTAAAYAAGMVLHWKPDVTASGGPTTLNIDMLGAAPLKLADGTSDPSPSDVVAGHLYDIWYDGAGFRIMSGGGGSAGGGAISGVFGRTGYIVAQTGDYTTAQVTESGNLYYTDVRARAALSGHGPVTFESATGVFDCPTCITTGTSADTDVSGALPHLTVTGLQGRQLATAAPADGEYLSWDAATNQWRPRSITASGKPDAAYRTQHYGYEVGSENASAAIGTADLTSHGVVINDGAAKTLVEASCWVDSAAGQTVTVKIGATTLFTITCANSINFGAADGTAGYISAASMASTAIGPHVALDLSGVANGTAKDLKLHIYGTVN